MIRKAIGATFILLLMTQVISAQQDSGSAPLRPGLHFKDDKPSRTKGQNEYDKDIDRDHQSKLKEIPDTGETDPWGISVPLHQRRPKTNNNDAARHFPPPLAEQAASEFHRSILGLLLLYLCQRCIGATLAQSRVIIG